MITSAAVIAWVSYAGLGLGYQYIILSVKGLADNTAKSTVFDDTIIKADLYVFFFLKIIVTSVTGIRAALVIHNICGVNIPFGNLFGKGFYEAVIVFDRSNI